MLILHLCRNNYKNGYEYNSKPNNITMMWVLYIVWFLLVKQEELFYKEITMKINLMNDRFTP